MARKQGFSTSIQVPPLSGVGAQAVPRLQLHGHHMEKPWSAGSGSELHSRRKGTEFGPLARWLTRLSLCPPVSCGPTDAGRSLHNTRASASENTFVSRPAEEHVVWHVHFIAVEKLVKSRLRGGPRLLCRMRNGGRQGEREHRSSGWSRLASETALNTGARLLQAPPNPSVASALRRPLRCP